MRRRLLSGLLLVGLVALAVPAPARQRAAPPAAPVVSPRYTQAATPRDHWQQRTTPVLVADQPWEQGAVYEPTVLYDRPAHLYRMWYTGGWERPALGYATSTDGIHWRKRQPGGPVIGLGAGGFGVSANNGAVVYDASNALYYLFFGSTDRALHVATSPDGVHWQTRRQPVLRPTATQTHLVNTAAVPEGRGASRRWVLLYETMTPAGIWEMGLARSVGPDPVRWQRVRFGLRTLQVAGQAGTYGGPWLSRQSGRYDLYYHATRTGNLPSDIYHATSDDLLHWHVLAPAQQPVLARTRAWEVDQTADPCLVTAGTRPLLYFAGMDNPHKRGAIGVAFG